MILFTLLKIVCSKIYFDASLERQSYFNTENGFNDVNSISFFAKLVRHIAALRLFLITNLYFTFFPVIVFFKISIVSVLSFNSLLLFWDLFLGPQLVYN